MKRKIITDNASISFENIEPKRQIIWSVNMNLRAMTNKIDALMYTLRRLSYRSHLHSRSLDVLDFTAGMSFMAMELVTGNTPSNSAVKGFLSSYSGNKDLSEGLEGLNDIDFRPPIARYTNLSFDIPQIKITTISDYDYFQSLLSDETFGLDDYYKDLIYDLLLSALDVYSPAYKIPKKTKETLKNKYEQAIATGDRISVQIGNKLEKLKNLNKKGVKYDLITCNDLMCFKDRVEILKALQSVLSVGGAAFIPFQWWNQRMDSDEEVGYTLIADKVNTGGKDILLEDYLAETYPNAFQVDPYQDKKVLIIKGTETPVEIPTFSPEIIAPTVSSLPGTGNLPEFAPDMPVMRWTLP